jgi:hypothetical protein
LREIVNRDMLIDMKIGKSVLQKQLRKVLSNIIQKGDSPAPLEIAQVLQRPNPQMTLGELIDMMRYQFFKFGRVVVWLWFDNRTGRLIEIHPIPVERAIILEPMPSNPYRVFPDYPLGYLIIKDDPNLVEQSHLIIDMRCVVVVDRKNRNMLRNK